ncbi:alpha/beta hydrolase [Leptospira sp. 96542]|nr:alpha/beta hydrolase [Leptospira sp. 96542]
MNDWLEPGKDSFFQNIDGMRIHYKRTGEGYPVLLLHGSGSSQHCFDPITKILNSQKFQCIRVDLPGFGLTGPRPDRDYRIQTYASTLVKLMESIGHRNFFAVGNSLGGNIAWNLALDYPKAVYAIILINATGYPEKSIPQGLKLARNPFLRPLLRRWTPRSAIEKNLKSIVGSGSTIVTEEMVDRVFALMSRPGNRSAFVDFANTNQIDRSNEIHRISIPTLVLRSAHVDGQNFSRDIKHSKEVIHETGGHLLPEEDPVWVAKEIVRFLNPLFIGKHK